MHRAMITVGTGKYQRTFIHWFLTDIEVSAYILAWREAAEVRKFKIIVHPPYERELDAATNGSV